MIAHTLKILGYELRDLMRSRWLLLIAIFFFVSTEALFQFGSDPTKVIVSLMNIVLIIIPLLSLILGTIYFYNSREFVELLLAQPMRRSAIFLGKLIGLSTALAVAFLTGIGVPFLIHMRGLTAYLGDFITLLAVAVLFVFIFVALAFMIASRSEEKLKGFGAAILLWLFLSVIYDGLVLTAIYLFRDYPLEQPLIILTVLNPIDLGRMLILLQLDISALMGVTGAVFREVFSGSGATMIASTVIGLWFVTPLLIGLRRFQRRDSQARTRT